MVEEIAYNKVKTIENMFGEKRNIFPNVVECLEHGEVFETEDGEPVYLEMVLGDFGVDELVRITCIAENLYFKYKKLCTCYILCMGAVTVNEMPIKSEAEFTIKLAQSEKSTCEVVLSMIKQKMKSELLDVEDIQALQMLPVMCDPSERNYYRNEVFSIMNELGL